MMVFFFVRLSEEPEISIFNLKETFICLGFFFFLVFF